MQRLMLSATVVVGVCTLAASASAHYGWGSYNAANPISVTGPIQALKFENPNAEIRVKAADKVWTVTLGPTSRMNNRGTTAEVLAVGKTVSVYGHLSTVDRNVLRAQRITTGGKTYELR